MNRLRAAGAALASALLLPSAAGAAGYGLYEQGARALGQAGAFTARADDPSSMFFNPAGLSRLDGRALLLSPNLIVFKASFDGADPIPGVGVHERTQDKTFFPFAGYYAHGIAGKVAAGIGVYNAYGLEVDWADPEAYSGRFISTRARITPFYFVPTVAVALNPRLRVGAGANLVLSRVELQRHLPAFDPFIAQTVDIGTLDLASEHNFGAGVNAGIQWWPTSRFKFGATYRSKVVVHYKGLADFTRRTTGDPPFDAIVASTFPPDQGVATSIPFPAQGSLGLAYQSCPSWAFEADLNYTWWDSFDRLAISFAQSPALDVDVIERWKSAFNVRVGTEYRKGGTAAWSYRAGYYFDQTPQPRESVGPLLPDTNRHGITLGLGRAMGRATVDAYGLLLVTPDRSTDGQNRDGYDGTYATSTFIAGASLGLKF